MGTLPSCAYRSPLLGMSCSPARTSCACVRAIIICDYEFYAGTASTLTVCFFNSAHLFQSTKVNLHPEIQAAYQESNSSDDPNHFNNKRATGVARWPRNALTVGPRRKDANQTPAPEVSLDRTRRFHSRHERIERSEFQRQYY